MDVKEIKELLKAFDESDSSYLRISQDGVDIRMRKPEDGKQVVVASAQAPAASPVAAPVEITNAPQAVSPAETAGETKKQPVDGEIVKAPLVGVFYSAPSPEEKPYVQVGDSVKEGQVLCLIEAMKMMSEITSPKDGVVKEIYAKNQDVVEFEQELFCIGE